MRTRRKIAWIRRTRRIKSGPYRYNEGRAAHGLEAVSGSRLAEVVTHDLLLLDGSRFPESIYDRATSSVPILQ
jgi:hypothetical protein